MLKILKTTKLPIESLEIKYIYFSNLGAKEVIFSTLFFFFFLAIFHVRKLVIG